MELLKVGVFGTSQMENEKRVPIHPGQLKWIDEKVRKNLFFEENYGVPFGVDNEEIASITGGMLSKKELFESCDVQLIPKPILDDFQNK